MGHVSLRGQGNHRLGCRLSKYGHVHADCFGGCSRLPGHTGSMGTWLQGGGQSNDGQQQRQCREFAANLEIGSK
nr:uncharacterized protein LOC108070896 isoform X2 [Drosophila kikkawai]